MPQHAEAKNVYQRIALEAFIEINLAADGRDADTISVMCDTGDDAGKEPPVCVRMSSDFRSFGFLNCGIL